MAGVLGPITNPLDFRPAGYNPTAPVTNPIAFKPQQGTLVPGSNPVGPTLNIHPEIANSHHIIGGSPSHNAMMNHVMGKLNGSR